MCNFGKINYYYYYYDVIKWKHFPCYWTFVRSPVNSPHKGRWRGALMFSLICARINSSVNNREAGDLRRHRAHYKVIVMSWMHIFIYRFKSHDKLLLVASYILANDDRRHVTKLLPFYGRKFRHKNITNDEPIHLHRYMSSGMECCFWHTTFSNTFSWMNIYIYEFRSRFHWSLFLRFQLTIYQHWLW